MIYSSNLSREKSSNNTSQKTEIISGRFDCDLESCSFHPLLEFNTQSLFKISSVFLTTKLDKTKFHLKKQTYKMIFLLPSESNHFVYQNHTGKMNLYYMLILTL